MGKGYSENRFLAKVRKENRKGESPKRGIRSSETQIINTSDDIKSQMEFFSEISVS